MIVKPILTSQSEGAVDTYRDKATGGYPLASLERLLRDCEEQPLWRDTADLCCAYVDGKQLTGEQKYLALKNNLVPRVTNLVGRTIRSVLGAEAKNRRDAHIEPDDDQWADVCDVMSVKLKQAQREAHVDMAVSNAYGSQVSAGIGWVEVSRVSDPLEFPYRVQDVHRAEIWWDWRAKHITLKDARWLCRKRWIDLDEAEAAMPQFADVFKQALNNWQNVLGDWQLSEMDERFQSAYRDDRLFNVQRSAWMDSGRQRIKFYEVWYRVPATVVMIKAGPRWIQFDDQNQHHVEAVARGIVQMKKAVTSQVRMALFAGPFRLMDVATKKRRFPYIPFFAFRDDAENTPYGLVHGMLDPQDEYNERRMRIQWMLKAQQIQVDADALDANYNNIADLAENAMRPDMLLVRNPNRKRESAIEIGNSMELQRDQFEVMQDSKQLIQDVPGVYTTQLGNAPQGVTSGIAINSLVEQGQVAMGELNDNYGLARNQVFEALLDLCAEDMLEPNMQVPIGAGDSRRVVVLNTFQPVVDAQGQPVAGPDGQPELDQTKPMNMVKDMCLNVGLAEVPSSPAFQMQTSQQVGAMVQALAGTPQVGALIPVWVENTSAFGPGRKQLADDMRRMAGLPVAGDRQGAQAWQAQQQEAMAQKQAAEQQAQADQTQALAAQTQHLQATTVLDTAQAKKAAAEATQINLDVAHQFHGGVPQPADPYPGEADPAANQPQESDLINQSLAEAAN